MNRRASHSQAFLPRLLLIRLSVLERKATHPLIRPRLPTDAPPAARKQYAPESHRRQKRVSTHTHREPGLPGRHVLRVAVQGTCGVEGHGQSERRDGVGRFGVRGVGRYSCSGG